MWISVEAAVVAHTRLGVRLPERFDPRGKQFEVVFGNTEADLIAGHLGAGRMVLSSAGICSGC